MLAPVIVFAYNRPTHLQRTIEALQKNTLATKSTLYVYSDFAKNPTDIPLVQQVRAYIQTISGFEAIHLIERARNWGLAKSVIEGVTEVLTQHSKAIILEDDMICSTNFLQFMNDCLDLYAHNFSIFSVSGYNFPIKIPTQYPFDVYIGLRASSWGWATWLNRWQKSDWQVSDFESFIKDKALVKTFNQGGEDLSIMLKKQQLGLVDSWAIRWSYTHFKHQAYCLYPVQSKIQNIGADNSGTHTPQTQKYDVQLTQNNYILPPNLSPEPSILAEFKRFFKPSLFRRWINRLKFGLP